MKEKALISALIGGAIFAGLLAGFDLIEGIPFSLKNSVLTSLSSVDS